MNLHDFQNGALDQYLGQLIGNTREAKAMQGVRRNVVLINESVTHHKVQVQADGIFLKKANVSYRTYLYLGRYNVKDYGLPKKHYFNCETVQQYTNFIATNQEKVDILCSQTFQVHSQVVLGLCKHCKQLFFEKTAQILLGESFDEFILKMACSPNALTQPLDSNGYPLDFPEISTAFRRQKNYTCENCHLTIKDPNDQRYIHTHHKDLNKSNNCIENFQCLCIECHSQIDDLHRRNFDTVDQRRELKEFKAKYRKQ